MKNITRKRRYGFRARSQNNLTRKIINRRRAHGRKRLVSAT